MEFDKEFFDKMIEIGITPHRGNKVIYHYTTTEAAKSILLTNSLRFSSPSTMNDPFEFNLGLLDFSCTMKYMKENLRENLLRQNPRLTNSELKKTISKISITEFKEATKKIYDGHKDEFGILCLSNTNTSTLMWSHYCKKHTGICIGITIPDAIASPLLYTMNVNYIDSIIPKSIMADSDAEWTISFMYWIYTKSHVWNYENEVRAVMPYLLSDNNCMHQKYCDVPIPKTEFREVYFGVATPQKDIEEILEIINTKYSFQKVGNMVINEKTFNLDVIYH